MSKKILIIEDEVLRFAVRDFLSTRGYEVREAEDCARAMALLETFSPDLIVTDYQLPDGNSIDLLARIQGSHGAIPSIMMTAFGSIELAVEAVKLGAEHFLTKPVRLETLQVLIERTIGNRRVLRKETARKTRSDAFRLDPFAGKSKVIRELKDQVARLLPSDSLILLQGETGTGKGVMANYIYRHGPRCEEPFVDLNCAGLSKDLLESELFGYDKGAFTGAAGDKKGLLEVADKGTAFLDEIGDIDATIQAKLLKVVEEKSFRHLGGTQDRKVDIRLLAATHRDLRKLVQENKFRSDLYYRISMLPVRLPPLRERREDLPELTAELLQRIGTEMGRSGMRLQPAAIEKLSAYHWPGNIRELKNTLERAVLMSDGMEITKEKVDFGVPVTGAAELELAGTLEDVERAHIATTLKAMDGNISKAAQRLGISRGTLHAKIKQFSLTARAEATA